MINTFVRNRAISLSVAVLLAVLVSHSMAKSELFWMPLTAFFVMQAPLAVYLRTGIKMFVTLVLAIVIGTISILAIHSIVGIAVCIVMVVSSYCYLVEKTIPAIFLPILFSFTFVLLITLLLPAANLSILYARLYDVTFGAMIGILTNLIVLPPRADVEFRRNIIPILSSYSDYLNSIANLLYHKEATTDLAEQQRQWVFPEWVYETGFSLTMQQGHRHFLIMTERVGQILWVMHYLTRHSFDKEILEDLRHPFFQYVQHARQLIQALITVLNLDKPKEAVSDLQEEIAKLEIALKNAIPPSLELLDLSKDYIYLTALLKELEDLRLALVNLAQGMRLR